MVLSKTSETDYKDDPEKEVIEGEIATQPNFTITYVNTPHLSRIAKRRKIVTVN